MNKKRPELWPILTSFNNLLAAFKNAARGKRSKPDIAEFEFDLEPNLFEIQNELRNGLYKHGKYHSFYIHDPKKRLISAAPFRDRVIHHALCNIIEPIFDRKFIFDSYANRTGKGTHKALDRCTYFLRRYDYVLPIDIRQFFPSIDHSILYNLLSKVIKDQHVLNLCKNILDSGQGVLTEEYSMVYFSGDDLFAINRPRGLPIGNLTSQFWANVYLNSLDHVIKRNLKCTAYVRYVDDMLLFSNDKAVLQRWREEIIKYLAGLRLTIHTNSAQLHPSETGIPFLGFHVFPDHRRIKRKKAINARRKFKQLSKDYHEGKISRAQVSSSIQGWLNHARYADTWGLCTKILQEIIL